MEEQKVTLSINQSVFTWRLYAIIELAASLTLEDQEQLIEYIKCANGQYQKDNAKK